jgi:L-aminopeptidase/D-esterase-like protein
MAANDTLTAVAENQTLTAVRGLLVGHWTDQEAATGCTAVLCPAGAAAGVDVRGGAPGTRETDVLRPTTLADRVHGILLGGGSAFGLAAADGVMRLLEERGHGFDVGVARVPLVPAAVVFDLAVGRADVRPDAAAGYAAAAAATGAPVERGCVGAGTGAAVGHALGREWATKSGLGSAAVRVPGGPTVAALAAVNAYGDVIDPESGKVVAGARAAAGGFADAAALLRAGTVAWIAAALAAHDDAGDTSGTAGPATASGAAPTAHTVIGVVATDAVLSKPECTRLALMAHDGLARAVRPAHTMVDGDTIFGLATGTLGAGADVSVLGALAAEAFARAVLDAVCSATSLAGLPCAAECAAPAPR